MQDDSNSTKVEAETPPAPPASEDVAAVAAGSTESAAKPAPKKRQAAGKGVESELIIPKGSVKRVIKIDKDVRLVAADAVLVITKATVTFKSLVCVGAEVLTEAAFLCRSCSWRRFHWHRSNLPRGTGGRW
jgi:hypothetical protein